MKMTIFLFVLLVAACANNEFRLNTGATYRQNISNPIELKPRFERALAAISLVASTHWSASEVNRVTAVLRIQISDPMHWVNGLTRLKGTENYAGLFRQPNTVMFAWRGELWRSAFGHEVLHHIVWHLDNHNAMHSINPVVYKNPEYLKLDLEITETLRNQGL